MMRRILLAGLAALAALAGCHKSPQAIWTEPPDSLMGKFEGQYMLPNGSITPAEAEVVGLGGGEYRISLRTVPGGNEKPQRAQLRAAPAGEKFQLRDLSGGPAWSGTYMNGALMLVHGRAASGSYMLSPSDRPSPTEGQAPPKGAIVLLPFEPGRPTKLDAWTNKKWKVLGDGSVEVTKGDNETKEQFGDARIHVEFMLPWEPAGEGQGRGNSGLYLHGRYEVQVLDSFGLPPGPRECGAVYGIAAPKVNASRPPLRWQTYDITFRAPRFSKRKVSEPARLTVSHNGVVIHENQKAEPTGRFGGWSRQKKFGPLLLQEHGHPVRYRNIWVALMK